MNTLQNAFVLSLATFGTVLPLHAEDKGAKSSEARVSSGWRASDIIGSDVKNASGENVGEIKDLLIDPTTGKISTVIISTGGFLGVADTLSAVSISDFRHDSDAKSYRLALTKDQLASGEKYTADEWKAAAAVKMKEARDAIGGDVTKPDNTARNDRDMEKNKLTPLDQGNSESDLQLTKEIRTLVVGSDLSFNAKNIKIISKEGQVTLRGVVESEEERKKVIEVVKLGSGQAKLVDELEVKK
jgi:Predicted periplasmic or secreted lipoprotein